MKIEEWPRCSKQKVGDQVDRLRSYAAEMLGEREWGPEPTRSMNRINKLKILQKLSLSLVLLTSRNALQGEIFHIQIIMPTESLTTVEIENGTLRRCVNLTFEAKTNNDRLFKRK